MRRPAEHPPSEGETPAVQVDRVALAGAGAALVQILDLVDEGTMTAGPGLIRRIEGAVVALVAAASID
jgi:hypothetical protein